MDSFHDRIIGKLLSRVSFISQQRSAESKPADMQLKPVITISREPGSGGRPIAEMVAKSLKFELLGERLVEEVARSAKKRKALIASVDEKGRGLVTDILQSVLNPDYISDMTYIRHVTRVVLLNARKGKAVILGRGANFMLPSSSTLRILIQAPYSVRVARAIKYEGVDFDRAREIIKSVDLERKQFVRQYFGKSISNANYYDLVLNTQHMTLQDAHDLIMLAFKKKFRLSSKT